MWKIEAVRRHLREHHVPVQRIGIVPALLLLQHHSQVSNQLVAQVCNLVGKLKGMAREIPTRSRRRRGRCGRSDGNEPKSLRKLRHVGGRLER